MKRQRLKTDPFGESKLSMAGEKEREGNSGGEMVEELALHARV